MVSLRSIALACWLCVGTGLRHFDAVAERARTPQTTTRLFNQVCEGWTDDRHPDCTKSGLPRLVQALQDENCGAAMMSRDNAIQVGEKIVKLKDSSPFVFLRGTAAFYYLDMSCEDPSFRSMENNNHPFALSSGDCHPENFGNFLLANYNLTFGVNDFDQAFRAPFTWDLKRGATAFVLACLTRRDQDHNMEECKNVVWQWVKGYTSTIEENCEFTVDRTLREGSSYLLQHAPMVTKSMNAIRKKRDSVAGTTKWLSGKIDLKRMRFLDTPEIQPLLESQVPEFQAVVNSYLYSGVAALMHHGRDSGFWKVMSVARKLGSGTGSIGLDRYWILVKGDKNGPRILEMKQVVNGVMEKYLHLMYTDEEEMLRVFSAYKEAEPFANLYVGTVPYKGFFFLIREKSKYKSAVELDKLSKDEFSQYAFIAGRAQAFLASKVSCGTPECELKEEARLDYQACNAIKDVFVKEPELRGQIVELSFKAAARHAKMHGLLRAAFEKCPELQANPIALLNDGMGEKCQ